MYIFMCVAVGGVQAHLCEIWTVGVSERSSAFFFLTGCLMDPRLTNGVRLAVYQVPRSSLYLPSPVVTSFATMSSIFMWVLGIELMSSGLQCKSQVNGTISHSSPLWPFLIYANTV